MVPRRYVIYETTDGPFALREDRWVLVVDKDSWTVEHEWASRRSRRQVVPNIGMEVLSVEGFQKSNAPTQALANLYELMATV